MMVIFLVGLVSMILMRTLRKDYARYSKEEEMDDMVRFLLTMEWRLFWDVFEYSNSIKNTLFVSQGAIYGE